MKDCLSGQCSPAAVQMQLEISLRALRVETIDLYQFHSGTDAEFQEAELWEMLARQEKAGKIRHLGVSIASKGGPLQAQKARAVGAGALQVVYNRLERRAEEDFLPHAQVDDLGVPARVPLASGFLTGKFDAASAFAANDFRSSPDANKVQQWLAELHRVRPVDPDEYGGGSGVRRPGRWAAGASAAKLAGSGA